MIKKEYTDLSQSESNYGNVYKVTGPLVVAESLNGVKMYELVKIGWENLPGEVIKLDGDKVYIQCFENTSGLTVGDPVLRTNQALSVELGPGILEQFYDGLQRPLEKIARKTESIFLPKGTTSISALDSKKLWIFIPGPRMKIGKMITGGDIIGHVHENNLFDEHRILLSPNAKGKIIYIAPEGEYTIRDKIIEVEFEEKKFSYTMSHTWPVRKPRPFDEKWAGDMPLFTGQRVLDALFPSVLGGACAIPGGFGCGKTRLIQTIAKYSNSEAVIYVECGERTNETVEVLWDFPELTTIVKGKQENIMQRTCLVANTSNMPVAAREASIYTGITLAEYFRDMGYNVSMIADSTSRWVEALREISCLLGENLTEDGLPATLSSKLAQFYGRAGRVKCLGSPEREGSVTIIGSISPPGGNFSDPFTTMTMNFVQTFWALDKKIAQRCHFPSVNWLNSYSHNEKQLESYFHHFDEEFSYFRQKFIKILEEEHGLTETVNLMGRDSLSEEQKLNLVVAQLIREDFLKQDAFSSYDYISPIHKTIGMMRCMITFYDHAKKAILESSSETEITMDMIKSEMMPIIYRISNLKFEQLKSNRQEINRVVSELCDDIVRGFRNLTEN